MAAFLTIYTPTYRRPRFLAACKESVAAQSDRDYQHLVIEDRVGVGVEGMFLAVRDNVGLIEGQYVYMLQDDDVLVDRDFVRELKRFVWEHNDPPVVIVRNKKHGLQPRRWRQAPQLGSIDLGSYVVRADVFCRHADQFGARYEGDYDFIRFLWDRRYTFAWWDRLVAEAQQVGMGRPEAA